MENGFGLTQVKAEGANVVMDKEDNPNDSGGVKTTWFEFSVPDSMVQEVINHLRIIGIDADPRIGM